jgi:prophage tail gpP-like protein
MTRKPQGIAELKIDDVFYGGWTRVSVTRSIEQMAGAFELDITERWPGQAARTPLRPGQKCQLQLDGQSVITGWVDAVSPDYDSERHAIRVAGRDVTCDLVDCSAIHKSGQWHNVTLDELARDLLAPFGVGRVIEADLGAPFPSYDIQDGESVFECLERAARQRALLLTSDPEGRLLVTRAGREHTGAALVEGVNIKAARAEFSWRERYSEIRVEGQERLGADGDTEDASPAATVRDENIARYRPLIVMAEAHGGEASFSRRAEWEKTIRRGRSCRGYVTVQGWTRPDGALWRPNTRVTVTSPWLWLREAEMLIAGCVYSLDDRQGTLTELVIARPEAFESLEGVETSKLFGRLKTRGERQKREAVDDWSLL